MPNKLNTPVILAAVTGAVVGAASAAYLADADNRKKIMDTAKKVGKDSGKYLEDFNSTAHEIKKGAGEMVSPKKTRGRKASVKNRAD